MPHCPSFMFDVASARAAAEFLSSEIGLEAHSQKYSNGLLEIYEDVTLDDINFAAEGMLQFLAEIEAGEKAVDDDTNINQWTDASKYAEEHYGDRLRDQQNYESYEGWN